MGDVKSKVSNSHYLGTYKDAQNENSTTVLASYGNNKSHVLAKTKRLAKKASSGTLIHWKVYVNDTMRQIIDEGKYFLNKICINPEK